MAKRDFMNVVSKTGTVWNSPIPEYYHLNMEDMMLLFNLYLDSSEEDKLDAVWRIIDLVFRFGFVMGNRATIRRKMRPL